MIVLSTASCVILDMSASCRTKTLLMAPLVTKAKDEDIAFDEFLTLVPFANLSFHPTFALEKMKQWRALFAIIKIFFCIRICC